MKAFLAALLFATAASAQTYPTKPIRLLLTFSSGGQADILARTVADRMRTTLGQPIVIEPKPGAGGNLAMEAIAKAPPDGYTLVFGTPAVAINGKLYKQLGYDPLKDLVPLGLAAWGSYVVYASSTLPVNNMSELIAYAKAKPNELNYASVGVGSGTHLAAVLFTLAAGVQMTHVPYKGIQQIGARPRQRRRPSHLQRLRPARAVRAKRPRKDSRDQRRAPQSGASRGADDRRIRRPRLRSPGWYGFFTTAGTPREVLQKLNGAIVGAVSDREISDRIEKMSLVPAPQSLEEASRFVNAEAQKWARAVTASGASAE